MRAWPDGVGDDAVVGAGREAGDEVTGGGRDGATIGAGTMGNSVTEGIMLAVVAAGIVNQKVEPCPASMAARVN